MRWWHEARFGMFVHWGLYAQIGRNEWVHAIEAIPMAEYEKLIKRFKPKPRAAREWAKLAKAAGMKYMVLTTKHHEGFCLWNSRQTDFNAMTACGRDLVQEYVDACREQGLKIGFYYSLMDWHHPDGARSAYDPAVRRRFLDFSCCCDGYWLPGRMRQATKLAIELATKENTRRTFRKQRRRSVRYVEEWKVPDRILELHEHRQPEGAERQGLDGCRHDRGAHAELCRGRGEQGAHAGGPR